MNELISIIIPAYNAEKYIEKCLRSILFQSVSNFEVIVVNDGSTDSTSDVVIRYQNNDSRIILMNKENEGPSLTRQFGLNKAKGKYIMFVDADDYIQPDMLEILYTEIIQGFDIVETGYRMLSESDELLAEVSLKNEVIFNRNECARHYAEQRNTTNFLWNKMYKSSLFDGVTFPAFYAGEDSCILTQLFGKANNVKISHKTLYNYVQSTNSLTRSKYSEKKLDNIRAGEWMFNYYSNKYPKLKHYSALHICSYCAQLYSEIKQSDEDYLQTRTYLVEEFSKYYGYTKRVNFGKNMYLNKKRFLWTRLFKINKSLAKIAYKSMI